LTWDELANLYDAAKPGTVRPARTLPMDKVFNWAEQQKDKFFVDKEGSLFLLMPDPEIPDVN